MFDPHSSSFTQSDCQSQHLTRVNPNDGSCPLSSLADKIRYQSICENSGTLLDAQIRICMMYQDEVNIRATMIFGSYGVSAGFLMQLQKWYDIDKINALSRLSDAWILYRKGMYERLIR